MVHRPDFGAALISCLPLSDRFRHPSIVNPAPSLVLHASDDSTLLGCARGGELRIDINNLTSIGQVKMRDSPRAGPLLFKRRYF